MIHNDSPQHSSTMPTSSLSVRENASRAIIGPVRNHHFIGFPQRQKPSQWYRWVLLRLVNIEREQLSASRLRRKYFALPETKQAGFLHCLRKDRDASSWTIDEGADTHFERSADRSFGGRSDGIGDRYVGGDRLI